MKDQRKERHTFSTILSKSHVDSSTRSRDISVEGEAPEGWLEGDWGADIARCQKSCKHMWSSLSAPISTST